MMDGNENKNKYFTVSVYVIISAACVLIFTAVCYNFAAVCDWFASLFNAMKPIIYGCIMALFFYPIQKYVSSRLLNFVERKKSHPNLRFVLSLTLTYIFILAVLAAFASIVVPQVALAYNDLASKVQDYIRAAQNWLNNRFGSSGSTLKLSKLLSDMLSNSYSLISTVMPWVAGFFGNLVTEIKNLLLGLIISVYFLASKTRLIAMSRKFVYAVMPKKSYGGLRKIGKIANSAYIVFVSGKLVDSLIIWVICSIITELLDFPYAPLLSLIIGIMNLIPFIGTYIGAIPGIFITFITKPEMTIWFILLVIAMQQLDLHFIEPHIVGKTTGLSGLMVIISVLVMGGLFGVVGMFLAVPTFTVIYAIIKSFTDYRLKQKNLSANTEDYRLEK